MTITQKTEDEAVIALHDNGLDVTLTVEAILEGPLVCLNFDMCLSMFSFYLRHQCNQLYIHTYIYIYFFFFRNLGPPLAKKRKTEPIV
jgi:hypothetical protein